MSADGSSPSQVSLECFDSQRGVIQVTVRVQVRQYIDNPWAALFIRVEDFDSYVSIGVSHCAMSSNEANV